MDFGLTGDVAIVFGGARGLGHAIAAAFHAEGAHVALVDISADVQTAAQALSQGRASAVGYVADVTDAAAVAEIARQALGRFGRIDHVVFAVAIGSGSHGFPFWKVPLETWERVLRVNLTGAANVAKLKRPEPYLSSASVSPATVPGTPTPRPELSDLAGSASPCGVRKMSRVVASGAASR